MLRLRARAAARPVQGMRRQQQLLRAPALQRYYCNCKECGGSSFSEHRRQRSQCKECGRSSFCEHGRPRDYCNCRVRWQQHREHGRLCTTCMKEYSGSAIHKHRRQRGLYEHRLLHRRQRSWCRIVAAAASFPWRRQRRQELDGDSGRTHKTLLNRRVA